MRHWIAWMTDTCNCLPSAVWARRNKYVMINAMGLLSFQAPWLPWVMTGFHYLLGVSVYTNLLGIAAGCGRAAMACALHGTMDGGAMAPNSPTSTICPQAHLLVLRGRRPADVPGGHAPHADSQRASGALRSATQRSPGPAAHPGRPGRPHRPRERGACARGLTGLVGPMRMRGPVGAVMADRSARGSQRRDDAI